MSEGLFFDNSFLSAILDRQRLLVAAPVDRNLRTKKAEIFSPAVAGLLAQAQEKESQRSWSGNSTFCVFGRGRASKSWRKTLPLFWDQSQERFGG